MTVATMNEGEILILLLECIDKIHCDFDLVIRSYNDLQTSKSREITTEYTN